MERTVALIREDIRRIIKAVIKVVIKAVIKAVIKEDIKVETAITEVEDVEDALDEENSNPITTTFS